MSSVISAAPIAREASVSGSEKEKDVRQSNIVAARSMFISYKSTRIIVQFEFSNN
jgi:hypothetical protein